ncbi:hypothetical protein MKX73_03560 [Solibacillus sp. FSL W7-1436]
MLGGFAVLLEHCLRILEEVDRLLEQFACLLEDWAVMGVADADLDR